MKHRCFVFSVGWKPVIFATKGAVVNPPMDRWEWNWDRSPVQFSPVQGEVLQSPVPIFFVAKPHLPAKSICVRQKNDEGWILNSSVAIRVAVQQGKTLGVQGTGEPARHDLDWSWFGVRLKALCRGGIFCRMSSSEFRSFEWCVVMFFFTEKPCFSPGVFLSLDGYITKIIWDMFTPKLGGWTWYLIFKGETSPTN